MIRAMKPRLAFVAAAVAAAVAAGGARANGDPASDVLPFSNVFLSTVDPKTSVAGRDLLEVTAEAQRRKFPLRVAVIYRQGDLGLIGSLWQKPQPYAHFLGRELIAFGRYHGTLLVAMPNGFGIFGPGATPKAKGSLAALPAAGDGSLDDLGTAAVTAVRRVAAADGHPLPAPVQHSGTPAWAIILGALGGAALLAGTLFFVLRRWLLQP
jgi:hypothetical protein